MPASNKRNQVANKKKGFAKKNTDKPAHHPHNLSGAKDDSTAALSRVLVVMVSIMVVVAAVLIKPLIEENGFLSMTTPPEKVDPADDPTTWPGPDPRIGFLVGRACLGMYSQVRFFCHKSLQISKRYFRATERIEPGEVLFEIPRSLQLWDLDALRDPWIRLHLFEASHRQSGNSVGSEAFLAAYLALQLKRKADTSRDWQMEILELAYYDVLGSLEDLEKNHPLFADADHMKDLLGFSEGYGVLQAYRNMIISEWEAFSSFSPKFNEMISQREYFEARMNVLTRAIRVGPPGPEQAIKGTFLKAQYSPEQLLQDELSSYKDILGIDLEKDGCIALIPIADLFNHHPQNNVEYGYNITELNSDGAFVVRADNRRIEKGFEPMASYATGITDAHLYARYGFVNGDGSSPAQVSLAFYHDILKLSISSQYDYFPSSGLTSRLFEFMERPVAEYLKFDDGYSECIPGPSTHPDEADLKLLKHKHLLRIANIPERWQFSVPARNPYSFPGITHDTPIILEPPTPIPFYAKENLDLELPMSTCRLMSLVVSDLDGKASEVLRENLHNKSFILKKGNDSLEYRSWMCLRRWMRAGIISFEADVRSERQRVHKMNKGRAFGSRDWGAANVRLGEMQSMQVVATIVKEKVSELWGDTLPDKPEYSTMEYPCPDEYQTFLFDEMHNSKYKIEL